VDRDALSPRGDAEGLPDHRFETNARAPAVDKNGMHHQRRWRVIGRAIGAPRQRRVFGHRLQPTSFCRTGYGHRENTFVEIGFPDCN
jgi:hypothetical protein